MDLDKLSFDISRQLQSGRKTSKAIAEELNVSLNTVSRRIERLTKIGILEIKGLVNTDELPNHMLGSKSGFDSIQECFEDLTPHIFAVETGLSSDPEMNWRVKNLDGHRKCDHRSWPADSIKREGICPVCSKPMTLGVLYRVEQLADRPLGVRPKKYHPFHHSIPLNEILSELLGVGPNTKKVNKVFTPREKESLSGHISSSI